MKFKQLLNNRLNLNQVNIETGRLVIRNLQDSDYTAYFNIFGNPNIALYDDFQPITEADAIRNIEEIKTNYQTGNAEQEFAVALLPGDETIGILYMKQEESRILIGYHFNENYQGKGYAIEAVKSYIIWINHNSTKKIEALVDHKNLPSIKLLKKSGFEIISANGDEWVFGFPVRPVTDNVIINKLEILQKTYH